MRTLVGCVAATLLCVCVPVTASAQSAIAGIVKDTSGAVLPGVTIEASSPVLIERTRNVVSDAQGNYKIVDLRPGVYTLTFSLPGFATVKRGGLELPSNFTMSVNADHAVGGPGWTQPSAVRSNGAGPGHSSPRRLRSQRSAPGRASGGGGRPSRSASASTARCAVATPTPAVHPAAVTSP